MKKGLININRKLIIPMLVFLITASSMLLGGEVHAERAIWVWGASKDVVLDTAGTGAKKDFFDFCAAPQGDATKAITLVFFDAKPYGYNLMTNKSAELRQFLSEAHAKGINIEFLSGDKLWATPDYRSIGESLIDEVTAFNIAGASTQRFDGIHYDVEPYLLDSKSANDPLDWDYDQTLIWNTYLDLLTNCQAKINTYNTSYDPNIRFGASIPYWYVYGSTPSSEQVIDRVNYIAIMDYRDTSSNIISGAQDEISYADSKSKKVYIGVETSCPTDNVDFPPSSTFYEDGNAQMESVLDQVNSNFAGNSSYAGIAIHYYEMLTGSKSYEAAYRRLWTASYLGYIPYVVVTSPNREGEVWAGTVTIQWSASDLDGDALSITLQYSADGGATWTNIATGLSNTGSYAWNTTGKAAGSNYLIKVTATDSSANHLTGYDTSNNAFSVSGSVTQTNITDLYLWNENSASLRLKWTPPGCTPRYYKIYRSTDGGSFDEISGGPFIATDKYVDSGLSGTSKYRYRIKAIYGDGSEGSESNSSNMLIPGNNFLIDCFEQGGGITYARYGATLNDPYPSFDTTDKEEGTSSLKLSYSYGGGWGAVSVGTLPVKVDISPYTSVSFWVKGGVAAGTTVAFQLKETGRSEGNETWQTPAVFISNTDWTEYTFNFSNFTRADVEGGSGNNRIDTHSIGGYSMFLSSGTPDGIYYVDNIKLSKEEATLGVENADYTFGTVSGTISDHRFKTGYIKVSYGGYDPPWTIRIWTNNGTGVGQAGLKGADGVTYIPLKVWCANYGPEGATEDTPPDEEVDDNWSDYWYRVPENDEMNSSNVYTWRRLCWSNSAQDASLSSPFKIYLGIDVNGKKNQQYQTTTLTIEYINE